MQHFFLTAQARPSSESHWSRRPSSQQSRRRNQQENGQLRSKRLQRHEGAPISTIARRILISSLTQLFNNWDECVDGLKAAKETPHAVLIGSPAAYHGSTEAGADLELQVLKAFPNAALFVEKVCWIDLLPLPWLKVRSATDSQFLPRPSRPAST